MFLLSQSNLILPSFLENRNQSGVSYKNLVKTKKIKALTATERELIKIRRNCVSALTGRPVKEIIKEEEGDEDEEDRKERSRTVAEHQEKSKLPKAPPKNYKTVDDIKTDNKRVLVMIKHINKYLAEFINRQGKMLVLRKKREKKQTDVSKRIEVHMKECNNNMKREKRYLKEIERLEKIEEEIKATG